MDETSGEPRYPVRMVMKRTGLTADLLRAWERRYGAVHPERSAGGQRLYSDADVTRLTLLRQATVAGHSIAEVARLDGDALEALLQPAVRAEMGPSADAVEAIVAAAMDATERLEGADVEAALKRGVLAYGGTAVVDQVVSRFLRNVGDRWHEGTLSPAHEHLASMAVRRVLDWTTDAYAVGARAPKLVVATPEGEQHEFGAMLVAAAAVEEGWRPVYLGANLPASFIAAAVKQVGARAVALSAVYGNGGSGLKGIRETAEALPSNVPLLVGGAAAARHGEAIGDRVTVLADIPALRRVLRSLRSSLPTPDRTPRKAVAKNGT